MSEVERAEQLLRSPRLKGNGPRLAALLGRIELERAVAFALIGRGWQLERASMATKLICLSIGVPELAGPATTAWHGLSSACHHHAYELSPSVSEVHHLLKLVREVERRSRGTIVLDGEDVSG